MNFIILSTEKENDSWKYRISTNGVILVLWFKHEPDEKEIERSVNRMVMG